MRKATCPYCHNEDCDAEWTSVGVGMVQIQPYICDVCGAIEIGPYDKAPITPDEEKMGWYTPRWAFQPVCPVLDL